MDLSFVIIGYNESARLAACLRSVDAGRPAGLASETIYVDGGSTDGSCEVARTSGAEKVLGGERRRRAAENRNLGLRAARGRFVQFLDGDMTLAPGWVEAALDLLAREPEVAVVFGELRERNTSAFYRAVQIDWEYPEGDALYCGGAALWRAEALRELGGFPEDVAYGEEPYLCWRLRNELGRRVYHMHAAMAGHDLAFSGFRDYWRRNVRCGAAYAEIAARCRNSSEPFWSREVAVHSAWGIGLSMGAVAFLAGPWALRGALGGLAMMLIARKTWQFRDRGMAAALIYALHTYSAKLAIAWGILRWNVRG